jgi:transposase
MEQDVRLRRSFSEEFKQQIVALYNAGKPVSDIAREYDIGQSTLNRWIKRINQTGSTKEKDNRTPEQQELLNLRRENKQLKMENDILKQAALIFAQK